MAIRGGWLVELDILWKDVPSHFENSMKWTPDNNEVVYKRQRWGEYAIHFDSIIDGKVLIMFNNCLNVNENTRSKATFNAWNEVLRIENWLEQKEFTKLVNKYI